MAVANALQPNAAQAQLSGKHLIIGGEARALAGDEKAAVLLLALTNSVGVPVRVSL